MDLAVPDHQLSEASRQQYLAILAKATSISDILAVQAQLDTLQSQIEQLQGQMAVPDQRDRPYSKLTVTVHEPPPAHRPGRPTPSGIDRAWHDSVHGFFDGVDGVVGAAGTGPVRRSSVSAWSWWSVACCGDGGNVNTCRRLSSRRRVESRAWSPRRRPAGSTFCANGHRAAGAVTSSGLSPAADRAGPLSEMKVDGGNRPLVRSRFPFGVITETEYVSVVPVGLERATSLGAAPACTGADALPGDGTTHWCEGEVALEVSTALDSPASGVGDPLGATTERPTTTPSRRRPARRWSRSPPRWRHSGESASGRW